MPCVIFMHMSGGRSDMAQAIYLAFVCSTCAREDRAQVSPGACPDCGAPMKLAHNGLAVIRYVEDPGHGWLIVTPAQLASYGITEAMISPYSYRSRDRSTIALEEDCDAGIFIEAFRRTHGEDPIFMREHQDPCPIRSWPGFGKKRSSW